MFSRKGQSALEYLMTYGWALIVIVIVIGALMLLIGNPSASSKGCTVGGTFAYVEQAYDSNTQQYNVVFTNGTGKTLTSDYSIAISNAGVGAALSSSLSSPWNAGINQTFEFTTVSPTNSQV